MLNSYNMGWHKYVVLWLTYFRHRLSDINVVDVILQNCQQLLAKLQHNTKSNLPFFDNKMYYKIQYISNQVRNACIYMWHWIMFWAEMINGFFSYVTIQLYI